MAIDPAQRELLKDGTCFYSTIIDWKRYNVDPWERIQQNIRRTKRRLAPVQGVVNSKPCAIVGYGPSLQDTWKEVRRCKTIFSCSGGYRFLHERGINPTFHVETDPQNHKHLLLGEPSRKTTFYVASHCDPRYFDFLELHDIPYIIFHIALVDCRVVPNEWTLNCGGTVGHFAFTIARLLGYRNFQFFGFDHSTARKGETHAGNHAGFKYDQKWIEELGLYTTKNWRIHIDSMFEMLDGAGPDITYKFWGDGLMQRLDRTRVKEALPYKVPMAFLGGVE